jgi:hypothetical protein
MRLYLQAVFSSARPSFGRGLPITVIDLRSKKFRTSCPWAPGRLAAFDFITAAPGLFLSRGRPFRAPLFALVRALTGAWLETSSSRLCWDSSRAPAPSSGLSLTAAVSGVGLRHRRPCASGTGRGRSEWRSAPSFFLFFLFFFFFLGRRRCGGGRLHGLRPLRIGSPALTACFRRLCLFCCWPFPSRRPKGSAHGVPQPPIGRGDHPSGPGGVRGHLLIRRGR